MKPGPKPKSPDGHPKARYHTRMATDLIAFLQTLPNAAEWLDGVIRAAMKGQQTMKSEVWQVQVRSNGVPLDFLIQGDGDPKQAAQEAAVWRRTHEKDGDNLIIFVTTDPAEFLEVNRQ